MSKGIIGVDIDLTVADSDISQWDYLQQVSDKGNTCMPTGILDYNLGNYFNLPEYYSMDYWRLSDIYDIKPQEKAAYIDKQVYTRPIQPIRNSVQSLRELSSQGWEIVFISHVKGNHHKSKVNWLKRHFPFMNGFVATKEKQYVNCDVFIDDRNNHLNNMDAYCKIKFDTRYEQDVQLDYADLISNDWVEIKEYINKFVEG